MIVDYFFVAPGTHNQVLTNCKQIVCITQIASYIDLMTDTTKELPLLYHSAFCHTFFMFDDRDTMRN